MWSFHFKYGYNRVHHVFMGHADKNYASRDIKIYGTLSRNNMKFNVIKYKCVFSIISSKSVPGT